MTVPPYYHQHEFPAYHSIMQENCLINFRILEKPSESYRDEKKKNDAMSADMSS